MWFIVGPKLNSAYPIEYRYQYGTGNRYKIDNYKIDNYKIDNYKIDKAQNW